MSLWFSIDKDRTMVTFLWFKEEDIYVYFLYFNFLLLSLLYFYPCIAAYVQNVNRSPTGYKAFYQILKELIARFRLVDKSEMGDSFNDRRGWGNFIYIYNCSTKMASFYFFLHFELKLRI